MDEDEKPDQFEYVPFVNTLTHHQLKVLVKKLWLNIHMLGNHLEDKRKDVTISLDHILDGNKPNLKSITDSKRFTSDDGTIIEYDTLSDTFRIIINGKITTSLPAMGYDEFVKLKYGKK